MAAMPPMSVPPPSDGFDDTPEIGTGSARPQVRPTPGVNGGNPLLSNNPLSDTIDKRIRPQYDRSQAADARAATADAAYTNDPAPKMAEAEYHAPNKKAQLIAGLIATLFSGSGIANIATGYMQGGVEGAKERYDREEAAAKNQYASATNAHRDLGDKAATYGGEASRAASDYERANANIITTDERAAAAAATAQTNADKLEQKRENDNARLMQGDTRIRNQATQFADTLGFKKSSFNSTLRRLQARDYNQTMVGLRNGTLRHEDALLRSTITMQVATLNEAGRQGRFVTSTEVKSAAAQAKEVDTALRAKMSAISADTSKTTDERAQLVGTAIKEAHTAVANLYGPIVAKHPEFGGAANMEIPQAEELPSGGYGDGGYGGGGKGNSVADIVGAVSAAIDKRHGNDGYTGGYQPPSGPSGAYHDQWENQPLPQHAASGANPANPANPAPPAHGIGHGLGHGPGAPADALHALNEGVSQHAIDYPTEKAFLAELAKSPTAPTLSQAQVQSLVATWHKTHDAHTAPQDTPIDAVTRQQQALHPGFTPEQAHAAAQNITHASAGPPTPPTPQAPPTAHEAASEIFHSMSQGMADAYGRKNDARSISHAIVQKLTGPPYNYSPIQASAVANKTMNAVNAPQSAPPQDTPIDAVTRQQQALHPGFTPEQAHAAAQNITHAPAASPTPPTPRASAVRPAQAAVTAAEGSRNIGQALHSIAKNVGIDPLLLEVLIGHESNGNQGAVSPVGARGRGQLMPDTAKDLGVDPSDPIQNMAGAAVYLKQQLDKFHSIPRALAAYNAGPGAVESARGGIPNFPETKAYVNGIMAEYLRRRRDTSVAQAP